MQLYLYSSYKLLFIIIENILKWDCHNEFFENSNETKIYILKLDIYNKLFISIKILISTRIFSYTLRNKINLFNAQEISITYLEK